MVAIGTATLDNSPVRPEPVCVAIVPDKILKRSERNACLGEPPSVQIICDKWAT